MRGYAKPDTEPTPRELEVAAAVLATDTLKLAASRLGISEWTARDHLANLRIRLRARHNEELFFRLHDRLAA